MIFGRLSDSAEPGFAIRLSTGFGGGKTHTIHGKTHSLWGELAYQFGGEKAYKAIQEVDSPNKVPNSQMIRAMLPDEPILILLDELVSYMAILDTQAQGALISFKNNLTAEISARKQSVLVITDPVGQPVYEKNRLYSKMSLSKLKLLMTWMMFYEDINFSYLPDSGSITG